MDEIGQLLGRAMESLFPSKTFPCRDNNTTLVAKRDKKHLTRGQYLG